MNLFLILLGKLIILFSRATNRGNGSTWPGHIALNSNKNFIRQVLDKSNTKIILVVGTNGKTTTSTLIQSILTKAGKKVIQNNSGANLLNGIASILIQNANILGQIKKDFAIFEIDENTLPLVLKEVTPHYLVALNLFRDQLDRYGEVDSIAKKWDSALQNLPETTNLILNADDPQIATVGKEAKSQRKFFGLQNAIVGNTTPDHASDSTYCPICSHKLTYKTVYFSHLGDWECQNCGNKRPKLDISNSTYYPLAGLYNRYNTLAAILVAQLADINEKTIKDALQEFRPVFGRQETITIGTKKAQIFLSKNPTGFNQSLRTIKELGAKHILFVLNDRIPDGRDVSWIWDTDIEQFLNEHISVYVSGDRCFDMSVRLKYSHPTVTHVDTHPLLDKVLPQLIAKLPDNETLYILPTYSAMLEVRKILTGKKIL